MGIYGAAVAAVWNLSGSMGVLWLRRGTYGDLWGCCGCGAGPMWIYGAAVRAVCVLWGFGSFDIYVSGYGARPMGLIYGARQLQYLCGTYGDLWGTYGGPMGDLWGTYGDVWGTYGESMGAYGGSMRDLWGIYGAISCWYGIGRVLCMGLQRLIYEDLWGCCGCSVETMGIYGGAVAAVWDLWGSMGVLWLRCGTYGADLWG